MTVVGNIAVAVGVVNVGGISFIAAKMKYQIRYDVLRHKFGSKVKEAS